VRADLAQSGDEQEPLDRGEDGDRRSDHPVADDQRDPEVGQGGDEGRLPAASEQRRENLAEHDRAALAVLAEAHREPGVLDGHQQDQRPDDQREHAEDVRLRRDRERDHHGQRVDRARADVAEDQPERP